MQVQSSELANVIVRRNVFAHMTLGHYWILDPVSRHTAIYRGLPTKLDNEKVRNCIIRFDPCCDQINKQDIRGVHLIGHLLGNFDEHSPIE